MALFGRYEREQLVRATSDLNARDQRLASEHAALRGRLEGERQLHILLTHVGAAAQAALAVGAAIERFAQAMRAPLPPLPRGRAGGLVRARSPWRSSTALSCPNLKNTTHIFRNTSVMPRADAQELVRRDAERTVLFSLSLQVG
jgi:hypothetical protein